MQGDIFHAHDPYIQYYGLYDKDQAIILDTAKTNLFHQYFTLVLTNKDISGLPKLKFSTIARFTFDYLWLLLMHMLNCL